MSAPDESARVADTDAPTPTATSKLTWPLPPEECGVVWRLAAYLCTRPLASPWARASTSATVTRLKSPGIVCFKALAATANLNAASAVRPVTKP